MESLKVRVRPELAVDIQVRWPEVSQD
jgi:hypothetical protein